VGARSLDPGEVEYLSRTGLDDSIEKALSGADAVYVALDVDVLPPGEVACFMPEPRGPSADEVELILRDVAERGFIAGVGVTGLLPDARNVPLVTRLLAAAGL